MESERIDRPVTKLLTNRPRLFELLYQKPIEGERTGVDPRTKRPSTFRFRMFAVKDLDDQKEYRLFASTNDKGEFSKWSDQMLTYNRGDQLRVEKIEDFGQNGKIFKTVTIEKIGENEQLKAEWEAKKAEGGFQNHGNNGSTEDGGVDAISIESLF